MLQMENNYIFKKNEFVKLAQTVIQMGILHRKKISKLHTLTHTLSKDI